MFTVLVTEKGGEQRRLQFDKAEINVGRVQGNDIILPKGNVSKRHSRLIFKDGKFIVLDLQSTNGTYVNGRKINSPLVVRGSDKIYIGDFILNVEESDAAEVSSGPIVPEAAPAIPARKTAPPPPPPKRKTFSPPVGDIAAAPHDTLSPLGEPRVPTAAIEAPPPEASDGAGLVTTGRAGAGIAPPLMSAGKGMIGRTTPQPSSTGNSPVRSAGVPSARPTIASAPIARVDSAAVPSKPVAVTSVDLALRQQVCETLFETVSVSELKRLDGKDKATHERIDNLVCDIVDKLDRSGKIPNSVGHEALLKACLSDIFGLGPIDALLEDPRVDAIFVNGAEHLFVDRDGQRQRVLGAFAHVGLVEVTATRLLRQAGVEGGDAGVVDARLPTDVRVNVVMPSVSSMGVCLTVIKPPRPATNAINDLVQQGLLSEGMVEFLRLCLIGRRNIVVSGATSVDVVNFVNALCSLIAETDRVVSVEFTRTLQVTHDNWITLSGGSEPVVTLVRHAQKMAADRILIPEMRAGESLEVLQLMSSGASGTVAGMCGRTIDDTLNRWEIWSAVGKSETGPKSWVRDLLGLAMPVIVQLTRSVASVHKVGQIAEVTGTAKDSVVVKPVFKLQNDGRFTAEGYIPPFVQELQQAGVAVNLQLLNK